MTMIQAYAARRLEVNGIVQGVGFRPFVYNLANHFGLKGEVANTSTGVSIHIEGLLDRIQSFETDLAAKCPPLAHIVEISTRSDKEIRGLQYCEKQGPGGNVHPDLTGCFNLR
jgi:hydrogenase maturation protein HypF